MISYCKLKAYLLNNLGKLIVILCMLLQFYSIVLCVQKALETKIGYASFYGKAFEGNETASGATFDKGTYIAAHPRYPFGTIVKVTNLENSKSINVKIMDRGPTKENQKQGVIIDLSKETAKALDFVSDGKVKVKVEVLKWGNNKRE